MLINVNDDLAEHTRGLAGTLVAAGVRAECDLRSETLGYKIRDAIAKKVPYIGVVGAKEAEAGVISLRKRGEKDSVTVSINDFVAQVRKETSELK